MEQTEFKKHESGLVQRLGAGTAFLLVVSSMVGSGVFKKVAPMSTDLGSAWLIIFCWILAGLISWFGALTNAEIAGQIAEPGGQYVYFKRIYGRALAFFFGWTAFTVIQSATIASVAYVFVESLRSLAGLPEIPLFGIENASIKIFAVLAIWLITAINLLGVHQGERLSNVVTSLVILCIISITILCFVFGKGDMGHFQTPTFSDKGMSLGAVFLGMLSAFWAYEGWNNLGFLAGEIKNPYKNIPIALAAGVGFVMLLYVSINMAYLYVLPVESFQQIHAEGKTISAISVVQSFMGPIGSSLIIIVIMIATLGTTNNSIMSASRVYFSMARDGLFFKKAAYCDSRYNVPSYALVFQAIWASVLVFSGSFDQLTDMLIFAAFIFYGLGGAGVFILRMKAPDAPRQFKVPGYPFVPAVFILFCVGLVGNSILERPYESGVGLALMATGIPFYFYWNRLMGKKAESQVSDGIKKE
jgi:APA family basic amino acid/polyamine antiporter